MAKKKAAPSHAGQLLFERLFHLLETLGQISDRLPWYNLTNSNAARFVRRCTISEVMNSTRFDRCVRVFIIAA